MSLAFYCSRKSRHLRIALCISQPQSRREEISSSLHSRISGTPDEYQIQTTLAEDLTDSGCGHISMELRMIARYRKKERKEQALQEQPIVELYTGKGYLEMSYC